MRKVSSALIALLAFGGISRAQPLSWELSFVAGGTDDAGNLTGGTEIRELVPWNPGLPSAKLYASNGYWEDTPGPEGYRTAQVLVLNSSHGEWQQDVDFGIFCPPDRPKCALATAALDLLHFTSDKNGTPVSVQVLVASTWNVNETPKTTKVYAKNNYDGIWHETVLSTAPPEEQGVPQVRSFGTHVDRITGQDWAFAGETPVGIFHGLLATNRNAGRNIIEWTTGNENVEFNPSEYTGPPCNGEGPRVTTFAEAGGKLFASICHQIYMRLDGATGDCHPDQVSIAGNCLQRWKLFWTDPEPSSSETGLRGLTTITVQGKDWLLIGGEGYLIHIYRIDPVTGAAQPELDVINFLSNLWNISKVSYTIAPYNRMPLWFDEAGTAKRIIGLESFVNNDTKPQPGRLLNVLDPSIGSRLEGNAWYLLRNAADSYELIPIPQLVETQMVAVRTAARSPFADECNAQGVACAIYFGGFDSNHSTTQTPCYAFPCTFPPLIPIATHNTAWIVKGLFTP